MGDSGDDNSLTTADLLAGSAAPTAEGGTKPIATKPTTPKPTNAPRLSAATGLVPTDPALVAPAGGDPRFDLILDAGDVVQVDVAMIDFDPTVELLDANSIGFNDDGPTSADSQLVATATTGGFHTVVVSAFDSNKCGLFDVTVTVASSGSGGGDPLTPPSIRNFFVTLSSTPERVEFDLIAGDRFQLAVIDGGGTDPFVSMNNPSGAPFGSDDDSGSATDGPLDAYIDLVATSSGRYTAFVESINGVSGSPKPAFSSTERMMSLVRVQRGAPRRHPRLKASVPIGGLGYTSERRSSASSPIDS